MEDGEENVEFKKIREVSMPRADMVAKHELENHAIYRDWCPVCVQGRGRGEQHRQKLEEIKAEDGPKHSSDFYYMSTNENSAPMLAMKFGRTKKLGAVALPNKETGDFAKRFFANFVKSTGVKSFINHSDNENALLSLKRESMALVPGVESKPREVPVGDHQANGDIESAVRELKGQMRSIRLSLEQKLGFELDGQDPLLFWIPSFSADAINRYRKGSDGKTAYERDSGRAWDKPGLEFGEAIHLKVAVEDGGRKRDWKSKFVTCRFVGHHSRNGSVMGLSKDGLLLSSTFNRYAKEQRWQKDLPGLAWDDHRGLPWDIKKREVKIPIEKADLSGPEIPRIPKIAVDPEIPIPRGFYVRREDVEKFGYTEGCDGCRAIREKKSYHVAHGSGCRARVFEKLEAEDNARVSAFREKMEKAVEQMSEEQFESLGARGSETRAAPQPRDPAEKRPEDSSSGGAAERPAKKAKENKKELEKKKAASDLSSEGPSKTDRKSEEKGEKEKPEKGSKWQKTGHGVYEQQRLVRPSFQEGGSTSSSSATAVAAGPGSGSGGAISSTPSTTSGAVVSTGVVSAEGGDTMDVEQALDKMEAMQKTAGADISSLGITEMKGEFMELASMRARRCFQRQGVAFTEKELEQVALMQVELGAMDIIEMFSPKRFNAAAEGFRLRPGISIDLCEQKVAGPHAGEFWDMSRDRDVEELQAVVNLERPFLLTGSPPCDPFSKLLNISKHKRDPAVVEAKRQIGVKHLRTSIRFYKTQYDSGRYFLHEHPDGAESWDDEEMQALQRLPGVFTVNGPMCHFDMQLDTRYRGCHRVYKKTRFVTNSRFLAELLDNWCKNEVQGKEVHRHLHLIGGIAKRAAAYPPKMVAAVLKGIKLQMREDGCLSELEEKTSRARRGRSRGAMKFGRRLKSSLTTSVETVCRRSWYEQLEMWK